LTSIPIICTNIVVSVSGYSILDDLPLFHTRSTDYFSSVPASVHEIKADIELRIPEFAFRLALSIAHEHVVYVTNGIVHVGSCVRTCISIKSR